MDKGHSEQCFLNPPPLLELHLVPSRYKNDPEMKVSASAMPMRAQYKLRSEHNGTEKGGRYLVVREQAHRSLGECIIAKK